MKNKLKIIFLCELLLLSLTLNFKAVSLPGDTLQQWEKWEKQQTFFPIGDAFGRDPISFGEDSGISYEVMYFKPLTNERLLTYRLGRDIGGSNKIYYEEFYITNTFGPQGESVSDSCKLRPLTQYPTLTDFDFDSVKDSEICTANVGVDFTNINNEETLKVLKSIYGERSRVIIDDLNAAKVLKSGQIFYKFNFKTRNRESLKQGPINVVYLKGNKFNYLITTYGMSIISSYDNTKSYSFEGFLEEWRLDEQLRQKMVKKEQQIKTDEARKTPFDL